MKKVLSSAWHAMTTLAVLVALLLMLGIASGPSESRSYQADSSLGEHSITLVHYESCSWWNMACKHRRFWHNVFAHGQRV